MKNIEVGMLIKLPRERCVEVLRCFSVGQRVIIKYDGGLGGVYDVEGVVSAMDAPLLSIKRDNREIFHATMGDILSIILLEDLSSG